MSSSVPGSGSGSGVSAPPANLPPPLSDRLQEILLELGVQGTFNFDNLSQTSLNQLLNRLSNLLATENLTPADEQVLENLIEQVESTASSLSPNVTPSLATLRTQANAKLELLNALGATINNPSLDAQITAAINSQTSLIQLLNDITSTLNSGVPDWSSNETLATRDAIISLSGKLTRLQQTLGNILPANLAALKNDLDLAVRNFNTAHTAANGSQSAIQTAVSQLRTAYAQALNRYLAASGVNPNDSRILANNSAIALQNLFQVSQSIKAKDVLDELNRSIRINGLGGINRATLQGQLDVVNMLIEQIDAKLATAPAAEQEGWLFAKQTLESRRGIIESAISQLTAGEQPLLVGMRFHSRMIQLTGSFFAAFAARLKEQITEPNGLNAQLNAARERGDTDAVKRLEKSINDLTRQSDLYQQQQRIAFEMLENVMRIYNKAIDQYSNAWTSAAHS